MKEKKKTKLTKVQAEWGKRKLLKMTTVWQCPNQNLAPKETTSSLTCRKKRETSQVHRMILVTYGGRGKDRMLRSPSDTTEKSHREGGGCGLDLNGVHDSWITLRYKIISFLFFSHLLLIFKFLRKCF